MSTLLFWLFLSILAWLIWHAWGKPRERPGTVDSATAATPPVEPQQSPEERLLLELESCEDLEEKIEILKRAAANLGLDKLLCSAYFDAGVASYPITITRSPEHIPAAVTSALEISREQARVTEITYMDRKYEFWFTESHCTLPDGEAFSSGDLSLVFDGERVLRLSVNNDLNWIAPRWKPFRILGYRHERQDQWLPFLHLVVEFHTSLTEKWESERQRKKVERC